MFREIVRKKQALSQEDCRQLLKTEKRGVLSIIGDDGYPYGLPINHYYNEEDGKLYFHSGKTGHKIDALRRNPKAAFCVYDSGWHKEGEWVLHIRSVIVFGRIRVVEDAARREEILRCLGRKYYPNPDDVEAEIRKDGSRALCLELVPDHVSGKLVNES